MKTKNPMTEKSLQLGIKTVLFCEKLNKKKHWVISNQLCKSGTSIGANIREAQDAQSRKDFTNKLNITLKEARETEFRVEIIQGSQIMSSENEILMEIHSLNNELIRMLVKAVKTIKEAMNK